MYEREPIERFLYRMNRKETWAGLFTFAMTVFGLLAVLSLVVLTVWGFSSYDKANTKLNETNAELVNAQQKVAELTTMANLDPTKAELLKAQTDLSDARQQIALKDQRIADLEKQLAGGITAPSTPGGSTPDCSKCDLEAKTENTRLRAENERISKQLRDCQAAPKRPVKDSDRTPVVNE